jgi:hypothetical protein
LQPSRETLVCGLVGLIFLGSAAIGRPLIYPLARAGVRRRAPDKVPGGRGSARGRPINYAVIGLMTAWTFWYAPRAIRRAATRLAAEQAKPSA